jgi:hypothetical protein
MKPIVLSDIDLVDWKQVFDRLFQACILTLQIVSGMDVKKSMFYVIFFFQKKPIVFNSNWIRDCGAPKVVEYCLEVRFQFSLSQE